MRGIVFLILLAAVSLTSCAGGGAPATHPAAGPIPGSTTPSAPATETAGRGCRADLAPRPLPAWARSGFSPATQPMPYVLGDKGAIVAILWADHDPLVAPPAENRANKILWVSRVSPTVYAPLRIRASLGGSGRTVTRRVEGGPGPSVVDLPASGCWSFDLTWGGRHDHLRLDYAAG